MYPLIITSVWHTPKNYKEDADASSSVIQLGSVGGWPTVYRLAERRQRTIKD